MEETGQETILMSRYQYPSDGQTSNLINSLINAINRVTQLLFDTALTRKTFFLVSSRHPLSIYLQCCVSCLISILIVMELTVQERVPIQIRWFNLPWTMPNIINTILFSVTQQQPKNKSRTIALNCQRDQSWPPQVVLEKELQFSFIFLMFIFGLFSRA